MQRGRSSSRERAPAATTTQPRVVTVGTPLRLTLPRDIKRLAVGDSSVEDSVRLDANDGSFELQYNMTPSAVDWLEEVRLVQSTAWDADGALPLHVQLDGDVGVVAGAAGPGHGSTVAVVDTVSSRGGFRGEELSTIGQLRDQCISLIQQVETAQNESEEEAEE